MSPFLMHTCALSPPNADILLNGLRELPLSAQMFLHFSDAFESAWMLLIVKWLSVPSDCHVGRNYFLFNHCAVGNF